MTLRITTTLRKRVASAAVALLWLSSLGALGITGEACIDTVGLLGDGGGGPLEPTDRAGDAGDGGDSGDGAAEAATDASPGCGPTKKDCLGGACVNGACAPVRLTLDESNVVTDVTVFGGYFFYRVGGPGQPGSIVRCPTKGCAAERKEIVSVAAWDGTFAMTVRADGVYYLHPGPSSVTVARCPFDGCPAGGPELLSPSLGDVAHQIVVHEGLVYFAASGNVWSCPVAGCRPPAAPPVALAPLASTPGGMALYGGQLVYSERGDATGVGSRVLRVPLDGGAPTAYPQPPNAPFRVVDVSPVGFVTASFAIAGGQHGKVVLYSGSPPLDTFQELNQFISLAGDAEHVYFTTTGTPSLRRKKWLATYESTDTLFSGSAWGLALDPVSVFFTVVGTPGVSTDPPAVYRLAK
ncbi:MAG: hypothetical protein JST00_44200 [Deltaproteobacteria bacterium]|nr:hypothetical protein [Deltaproteobacteria bacterium]